MSNGKYIHENRQLKHQLEMAQLELSIIKGSKAFKAARILSTVKKEALRSPVGFTKKAIKKLASGGGLFSGVENAGHRIAATADIATQYKSWIALNEPDEVELRRQVKESAKFSKQPLISIVTPVFNPPKDVFIELIESVLSQTYPNFELCLGNFGDKPEIAEVIEHYASIDKRIKDLRFTDNQGIAANSNKILEKTKGDYIALLDHDDTISPDALYENVKAINETDADFLFSDKDKIDEQGNRFDPFFKPGWSPEIMLNANYLTHLNVMRKSAVEEIGAWSSDTDGAQDWDLFLKFMAATDKIVHIPKVLYHWRVIATSTAMSIETKPYALKGQRVAVDRYLEKLKVPAHSYHIGAELLLEWDVKTTDVHVYILQSTPAQTRRFKSGLSQEILESSTVVSDDIMLRDKIANQAEKLFAIVSDRLNPAEITYDNIHNLAGWLTVPGVSGASPRVTDAATRRTIDCGAITTPAGLIPTFRNAAPYQQDPCGNVEWVRDVTVGSTLMFVGSKNAVSKLGSELPNPGDDEVIALQLLLSNAGNRIVHNPKAEISLADNVKYDAETAYESAGEALLANLDIKWPYYNKNVEPDNVGAIISVTQLDDNDAAASELPSPYSIEAMAHSMNYAIDDNDIALSRQKMKEAYGLSLPDKPSFMFILPGFTGIYAGLNNIFSFAEYMMSKGSTINFAFMIEHKALAEHRKLVEEKYPVLAQKAHFMEVSMRSIDNLPTVDIAICTQWASAYILLKYNNCSRKCYFIQDKEASFYPKGSISALVDNTYDFGFYALANTPGLLEWYQTEYGGEGITIKSKVDLEVYSLPDKRNESPTKPYKVFFYGRPGEPRNAFELGVGALCLLKQKYKDDIQIFAAGASWSPAAYGLDGIIENLGKISYDKLPSFYRSMDAGLMFMFSGHPGVVASELMASGCPVVVNRYDDETWKYLYKNEVSAIESLPTSKAVFESLDWVLSDTKLRGQLIEGALETVNEFYAGYPESCDVALERLKQPLLVVV